MKPSLNVVKGATLIPNGYEHQISPCNINAQVLRIKGLITRDELF